MEKMATISTLLIDGMLKKGATRQLISKIEDFEASKAILIKSMNFLTQLAQAKPAALKMMNNQKVIPAVLGCLQRNNNDEDLAEASAPLLQLVSELKDSDFIKDIDSEIQDLIESLDQSREDFTMSNAMDNLEVLNNFGLVEAILDKCVEMGLIEYEFELLKTQFNERNSDDAKLHQRVLNACTSSIKRLA